MLTMYIDETKNRIIKNVVKVIRSNDINKLSKESFKYISCCCGFMHFNDYIKFMNYFSNTERLRVKLLMYTGLNFEHVDFEYGFIGKYFAQREDMYKQIINQIGD